MPSEFATLPKQLGAALRELRKKAGLSQMALAEKAGLAHNFVGAVERGEKLASVETVARLAAALGLKCSAFLAKAGF